MAQATLSITPAPQSVAPGTPKLLSGELVPQSTFPQAVFNTDASIRAWNQHVQSLTDEERQKFLQHSRRSVHEYSIFVEETCRKYQQQSRTTKINRLLRPFFKTLNLYLPTLANAAQADPYPSSLVVGGIMCILQISEGLLKFQEQLSEWLEKLSQEVALLLQYDICIYQYDDRVQDALVLVYGDVLNFCQKAYRLFFEVEKKTSLRIVRKSLRETFVDTFGEVITNFNAHLKGYENIAKFCDAQRLMGLYQTIARMDQVGLQTLQEQRRFYQELLQATHDMAEMTRLQRQEAHENAKIHSQRYGDIASALDEAKEESKAQEQRLRLQAYRAQRNQKKTVVLEWLRSVEDDHDRRLQKLMPGTGQWLLEHPEYKSWKNGSTSEVLWIKGNHGCGKSILAAVALRDLEEMRDSQTSVAHFYCDKLSTTKKEALTLFSTLLKHLCLQFYELPADLEKIYDKKGLLNAKGPGLDDVQSVFPTIVSKFSTTYILVDALDECEGQKIVLQFVKDLLDKSETLVKIIVFSRPEYIAIKNALKNHPQIFVDRGANPGEDGENAGDIRLFIAQRLSEDEYAWNDDPDLVNEVKDEMLKKAEGMFLYVDLVVERLQGWFTPNEVRGKLRALPDGLTDSYEEALERIRARDSSQRDLALKILIWVSYAERPLSRNELLEALSIKAGITSLDKDDRRTSDRGFVTLCEDLITYDEDGFYHLNHSSFKDFLQSRSPSISVDFKDAKLQSIEPDGFLAEVCLTYLLLDRQNSGPAKSEREYKDLLSNRPLLQYCALYWGLHVGRVQSDPPVAMVWDLLDLKSSRDLSLQIIVDVEEIQDKASIFQMESSSNPLHLISHFGLKKMAKLRSELRSHAHQADRFGLLPLDYAVSNGQQEMCTWLLSCESNVSIADATARRPSHLNRALHVATKDEWEDVVELLISSKYPLDSRAGPDMSTPLTVAVREDLLGFVNKLIAAGANVNAQNSKGYTPLLSALARGSDSVIMPLIEAGADVNAQTNDGFTPLHVAALEGNLKFVKLLLNSGAVPRACSDGQFEGQTPVHHAAEGGNAGIIRVLDDHNADLEAEDANGARPLHFTAYNNTLSVARALIDLGVDKNPVTKAGSTLLHCAVTNSQSEFVQFVLGLNPEIDAQDEDGETPLYLAASSGKTQICDILLKNGASVDIANNNGQTALWIAAGRGHENTVNLLLDAGASANHQTSFESTPLLVAAYCGHHSVIRPLIGKGADPHCTDVDGDTGLHRAVLGGHTEYVREILALVPDLDLNPKNKNAKTPLHFAAELGHLQIVQILLENNATSNVDSSGNLPIHLAAWDGHFEIVSQLLSDQSLNVRSYYSRTLLHIAAFRGHQDIALLLLDNKADTEIPDERGNAPLLSAASNGHEELCDLLISRGANLGATDDLGSSLSHKAAEAKSRSLMKKVMDLGCNMRALDAYGYTPFMDVVNNGNVEVVDFLLEHQIDDRDRQSKLGKTCLQIAASSGNNELVQKMLGLETNLDSRDCFDRTALGQAAVGGHVESVKFLTNLGFGVNGLENSWMTPLYDAVSGGFLEVIEHLLQQNAEVDQCVRHSKMTPLMLAAALGLPGIVHDLLKYGADPLLDDAFGKNALDYAVQTPKVVLAMDDRGYSRVTKPWAATRSRLETTVQDSILQILPLGTTPQPSEEIIRLMNMCFLAQGLLYLNDLPSREFAKFVLLELVHPPKDCLLRLNLNCQLCNTCVNHKETSLCCECYEFFLCQECHSLYQKGGNTPRRIPEEYQEIQMLEHSIHVMMHTMLTISKENAFDPKLLAHILNMFPVIGKWTSEKLETYEDWDSKYNERLLYNHIEFPGREFLKICTEIEGLSGSSEENVSQYENELSKEQLSLQERLGKFYSENYMLRERAEFTCAEHDYLEISLQDYKNAKEDRSVFNSNGRITNDWFKKLLKRYSKTVNTFGEVNSLSVKDTEEHDTIRKYSNAGADAISRNRTHATTKELDEPMASMMTSSGKELNSERLPADSVGAAPFESTANNSKAAEAIISTTDIQEMISKEPIAMAKVRDPEAGIPNIVSTTNEFEEAEKSHMIEKITLQSEEAKPETADSGDFIPFRNTREEYILSLERRYTSPSLSNWGSAEFPFKRTSTASKWPSEGNDRKFVATFSANESVGIQRLQALALADVAQPGYRRIYLLDNLKDNKLKILHLQVEFDTLEGSISEHMLRPQYVIGDRSDNAKNITTPHV